MEKNTLDIMWIVIAASLVFFMQAGFAFVESGFTRSKNSINVAIKNLTDLGISLLVYWIIGFALMFGATKAGLFGTSHLTPSLDATWLAVFFLFQAMFCSTSATIVSGAVAERMRFSSYIVATLIMAGIIYPVSGHWAWGGAMEGSSVGWLGRLGFVDFAGSSVVHSVGGWVSLAALLIIGARKGRFVPGQKPRRINGSDIPAAVVGVFILWFGWFGFNGGSTLAFNGSVAGIIIHTALGAAAGMVGTLLAGWAIYRRPDVEYVTNGALAGLVAITASCHAVTPGEAIIIGAVGGVVMLLATELLIRLRIDDAVGAIPVHLAAGIWGTIAVALFGDPGKLGTGLGFSAQLIAQLTGIGAIGAWSFGVAFILLFIINKITPLRVSPQDEDAGLNIAEHGASTEIYDLYRVMDTQAATGRLDLRAPEEPFTEIGQIARRYNTLLASLENHVVARSDYNAILDNISDGFFLVDDGYRFAPHYSRATEHIFARGDLAGERLTDLLSQIIPGKGLSGIEDYLSLLFDANLSEQTLRSLNPFDPVEIHIDRGGEFITRNVRIFFRRIFADDHAVRLMGIVQDITEQSQLSREMDRMKRTAATEMEMFYRVLHMNPQIFSEFLTGADMELRRINAALESSEGGYGDKLDTMFRAAHTLKGDARLLEMDFFAIKAHEFEDEIVAVRKKASIESSDFIPLAVRLSELMGMHTQLRSLASRINAFQCAFVEDNVGSDLITWSLKSLIDKAAADQGRTIRFSFASFTPDHIPLEMRKNIKDALVQLTRNAIAHGIESAEDRTAAGKSADAVIEIGSAIENGELRVFLRDDGRGLDYEIIRARAVAEGLMSESDAARASRKDLAALIFESHFSTAAAVSQDSGRGAGMGVVRKAVERLNGRLVIRNTPGRSCEFELLIPVAAC